MKYRPPTQSQVRAPEPVRRIRMRTAGSLVGWLLVAAFVGYPLLGSLVAMTGWPSLAGSIPVRLFMLLLSLYLIVILRANKLTVGAKLTLFFWLLYLSRLLWDLIVPSIPGASEALGFFIIFGVTSSLAVMLVPATCWDEARLARMFAIVGACICIIAFIEVSFDLAGDRSLFAETGRLSVDTVNPITYGHVAVTTLIACFRLAGAGSGRNNRMLALLAAVAAIVLLKFSGSRGPLVSLVVCMAMLGLCNRPYRGIVLVIIPLLVVQALLMGDSVLEQRVSIVEDDPSSLERILMQTGAIQQYLDNPILGSAFVEFQTNTYPHNPFIEAAMATGTLGLVLLLVLFGMALWQAIALLRAGFVVVPLLAIQFFVAVQFSGSLSESNQLWIALALMFSPYRHVIASAKVEMSNRRSGRMSTRPS